MQGQFMGSADYASVLGSTQPLSLGIVKVNHFLLGLINSPTSLTNNTVLLPFREEESQ